MLKAGCVTGVGIQTSPASHITSRTTGTSLHRLKHSMNILVQVSSFTRRTSEVEHAVQHVCAIPVSIPACPVQFLYLDIMRICIWTLCGYVFVHYADIMRIMHYADGILTRNSATIQKGHRP